MQHLLLDLMQRSAHCIDLRQHVDAVAVVFHHAQHAAHLTLDPLQSRRNLLFVAACILLPYHGGVI